MNKNIRVKNIPGWVMLAATGVLACGVSLAGSGHSHGVDTALFFENALTEPPTIEDCTLADGTETTCYKITIAGAPSNHEVGPFCPRTTSDTAETTGIWFDGNAVYDLDGDFVLGLAQLYNDDNWKMYDEQGKVNVTDTPEAFNAAARPDVDPAFQNYCVEGQMAWLPNGEPVSSTVMIPVSPVLSDNPDTVRGSIGITLNGVIIDGPAPVDAILGAYTVAAFDDCGGHINPFAGYHLHGARGCSESGSTVDGETPVFAYALDGFAIHSPLESTEGLDECQGHTTENDGYHYHAASAQKNAVLSCFTGVPVKSDGPGRGRPPREND